VSESSGSTGAERNPAPNALDERVTRTLARADATEQATAETLRPGDAKRTPAPAADTRARTFAGFALLVAIAGSSVQTALGTAGTALRDAQGSMQRLDGQLADMRKRVDELAATQAASSGDVDTLRNQVMETAEAMQELAVKEPAGGERWIRAPDAGREHRAPAQS
jgi:hypothetical protein